MRNTFRTLALCAALAAAAVACDEKKNGNNNNNNNGTTSGQVGGVTWAACNVDDYQTFAARPDMYTKLYQWNRSTAWAASGSISGWDSTANYSTTWTINPCPAGWRLPTRAEQQALHNAGYTWADANTRGNAVAGMFYGTNHATASLPNNMENCVFLPAVGSRSSVSGSAGTLYNQGSFGFYWSATQNGSFNGYNLYFRSAYSDPDNGNSKTEGFPIRCVK